jgi:holo-[acyl-carrier protein] synthase
MIEEMRQSRLKPLIARRTLAAARRTRCVVVGNRVLSRAFESDVLRVSIGVDVVSVVEVEAALRRFGDRYVSRAFTASEAAYCRAGAGATIAARLAARFAAKEAAVKALRPRHRWVDWTAIEVQRHRSGRCALVLHRQAAALALRRGIAHLELSMSHDGDRAVAVVVAMRTRRIGKRTR